MNPLIIPCQPILFWDQTAAWICVFPEVSLPMRVLPLSQADNALHMISQRLGSLLWSLSHLWRSANDVFPNIFASTWLHHIKCITVSSLLRHCGQFEWLCHFHIFNCFPMPQIPKPSSKAIFSFLCLMHCRLLLIFANLFLFCSPAGCDLSYPSILWCPLCGYGSILCVVDCCQLWTSCLAHLLSIQCISPMV